MTQNENTKNLLVTSFTRDGVIFNTDPEGRRLLILSADVVHAHISVAPGSIFVMYEGEGAYIWEKSKPMNTFVLISAGFSGDVASTLSGLLNAIKDEERQAKNLLIDQTNFRNLREGDQE